MESNFQKLSTKLLLSISTGEINATDLAKSELADRGIDSKGTYIGFLEADKHHFPKGRPTIELPQ